ERLPSILGTPSPGERAGAETFDGAGEVAVFPGDLPDDAQDLFDPDKMPFTGLTAGEGQDVDYRFVRFRPRALERSETGEPALPPHRPRPRAALPAGGPPRMSAEHRKPAAFRLDDPQVVVAAREGDDAEAHARPRRAKLLVTPAPEPALPAVIAPAPRRR